MEADDITAYVMEADDITAYVMEADDITAYVMLKLVYVLGQNSLCT